MNAKDYQHYIKKFDNPKSVLWTVFAAFGASVVTIPAYIIKINYQKKKEIETAKEKAELARQQTEKATECDVLKTAARTACEIMRHSNNVSTEFEKMKNELRTISEELARVKNTGAVSDLVGWQGRSSANLFNRSYTDTKNWIVDGYMRRDLINLLVAGGGVGKSILLVEIARAVDAGNRPEFLPDTCENSVRLAVVYYRMEDFPGELEGKYGKGKILLDTNITWVLPEDLESNDLDAFLNDLKRLASNLTEDTLVCVDPATKFDDYKHKEFISGAEEAQRIASIRGFSLTLLASIHLDEINDWAVLTNCDIKGGDKGLQLAGSVTAFRRERTGENFRFLQSLKEPKGSPKPFNGDALVVKAVEERIDEENKYLHYEYDCIKKEVEARPMKPKVQDTDAGEEPTSVTSAPNQKVTHEIEAIILSDHEEGLTNKEIAAHIKKSKRVEICEKTVSRTIKRLTGETQAEENEMM